MTHTAKRTLRRVLVLIVVAALLGATFFVVKSLLSPSTQRSGPAASGLFAAAPSLQTELTPAAFDLKEFVPLLGTGNTTGPVTYGDARVMAGAAEGGRTVLLGLADGARAAWQTSLTGPLIACSVTPMGSTLPCLVKSSTGTLVALIDLTNGVAKWVWEDAETYVNVTVNSNGEIVLLGADLSLTRLSRDGVLLSEPILHQEASEAELKPDASGCKVGAATRESPETFRQLSASLYLVGHSGINTFLTITNNQANGTVPGALLADPEGGADRWVVAPSAGCAPAAVVSPARNHVRFLPADVSVPIPVDHTIPDVVIRGGHLHVVTWDGPTIGQRAFGSLPLTFDGTPRMAGTEAIGVVAGDRVMTAFSKERGVELWSLSIEAHDFLLAGDVVVIIDKSGTISGYALGSGKKQWQLDDAVLGTLSRDGETLRVAASSGVYEWQAGTEAPAQPVHGTKAPIGEVSPGITYAPSACMRVQKHEGDDRHYTANTTPVDCGLEGAEPIAGVVTSDQVPRGGAVEDYLKACLDRFPTAVSAVTLTSPQVDASLSAICTGNPHTLHDTGAAPAPGTP